MNRTQTKQIHVGSVAIGGGAPVAVQSMCNTHTSDAHATIEQIARLHDAGCEIIRLAVPDQAAADALPEHVRAGIAILKAAGLRREGVRFVSCPTCGRTQIDLIALAQEVEQRLQGIEREITVAVMGCVVNGPGEAREADYGIAGGKDCGLLFRRGEILGKYPADKLADALVDLILSEK